MLGPLSQRVLSLLQLTRMALVFTAIADSGCAMLIQAQRLAVVAKSRGHLDVSYLTYLDPVRVLAMVVASIGLYGFGMSLNDIIDRRRDRQISPNRPLPSGRIGVFTAHVICTFLVILALTGAGIYAARDPQGVNAGWRSIVLVLGTIGLITFYDAAGKYLVAMGLISLGLVRFFHAAIAAPLLPLLWHPLLLLNHVVILSTVAYRWEEKRPPLNRSHLGAVIGGLGLIDVLAILAVSRRRAEEGAIGFMPAMWIQSGLLFPALTIIAFIIFAFFLRRKSPASRVAGQTIMLYGLLWLIVYDAAFVAAYVSWLAAGIVFLMLPVAWWSVQFMRWWTKVISLGHRPTFQRARV